ncbi:MAG: peptide chain release factor N(5)-glutamine methyltransferase [Planctomycetes bacterium]|nr:peptide chain release factor N(5)-glutamine methyltransferase [Planctomycetota bacterium]
MTVHEALGRATLRLKGAAILSARLEAELLLAHVLHARRLDLHAAGARELAPQETAAFETLLGRRERGEPVAYLTGRKEFYSLELEVTRDVLVPRPETEMLVDRILALRPERLLDLGTGSGCVAVACAVQLPGCEVTATDVSGRALAVARRNAERHGARIRFLEGDLYEAVPEGERFDVIASNPPYVRTAEAARVATHEPLLALDGGPSGLSLLKRVIEGAPGVLAPGGTLLCEIGEDQEADALKLAGGRFSSSEVARDLAGHPRLLIATRYSVRG